MQPWTIEWIEETVNEASGASDSEIRKILLDVYLQGMNAAVAPIEQFAGYAKFSKPGETIVEFFGEPKISNEADLQVLKELFAETYDEIQTMINTVREERDKE